MRFNHEQIWLEQREEKDKTYKEEEGREEKHCPTIVLFAVRLAVIFNSIYSSRYLQFNDFFSYIIDVGTINKQTEGLGDRAGGQVSDCQIKYLEN